MTAPQSLLGFDPASDDLYRGARTNDHSDMPWAANEHVIDDRDAIRSPRVASPRRLDDQRDVPNRGSELGHAVHRLFNLPQPFPFQEVEASIDIHPGGQRDGLHESIAGEEHPTAPGARQLDGARQGSNRPVFRAGVRVVTAENRIVDEHAAAVHRPPRREML
ncbi:hypothetical protein [Sorangium sp. So ce1099]|uniref:hypothetical protein n=1 Tax=Sorangium sp. So ce1099 TaxID=3133331 RepID=UPI003F5E16EE